MTDVLHIPAQLDAPIACDLSTAEDTAEERLADYQRQFERALLRRERREDSVVFAFRAEAGRARPSTTSRGARPRAARSSTTASRRSATR